ncbi:MAG TPA: LysR family transcriptional regulator substrate-binding protein, partial [Chondromyces sp.]|nr:LysR family transcriptional regulator substrate-binding protein [Chondromyces sp.]
GFLSLTSSTNLEVFPLKKDRLLCLVPDSHPLSKYDQIEFSQIEDEPFIMPKYTIDSDVRHLFKVHKIKPKIKYEIEEDQAIISMVQNNIGISILPEMILYRMPENIRAIQIEGDYYRSIGIVAVSFKHISPGAKKLIEFIQEWLKDE